MRRAGFSLVEVVISMALLSGVLVAIGSMFVMGGTYIKSGKQLTQATALSQDIMENFSEMDYSGLYLLLQGGSPDPNATVATSDTRTPGSVADTLVGTDIRSKLHNGYAVMEMTPIGGTVVPATFDSGEAIRVNVELGWTELRRDRTVKMETLRF